MESRRDSLSDRLDDWLAISLDHLANDRDREKPDSVRREFVNRFRRAQRCLLLLEGSHPSASLVQMLADGECEVHDLGRTLGRFQIVQELGRGGHGIVYLAIDPVLKRRVALKVPRPETVTSPDLRRRFIREARAVAELSHPNLIPVLEVGETGPACYIAQQFCDGPTLSAWLKDRQSPVPHELAGALVKELAEATQFVHGHGIIHRDIKPGNVLLERLPEVQEDHSDDSVRLPFTPKLTDFGLAMLTEEPQSTRTGAVLGTPAYMAPEQAAGTSDQIGPATDVYALGGILYELLTGQPPVGRAPELETIRRVADGQIPAPRSLRPDTPRDLEAICLKCLELDPASRYASAGGLAKDLDRFLSGEPTSARPIGPIGRYLRWSRRRPVVAALSAALVASVAVGMAGVISQWHTAEAHRVESDANFQQAHGAVQELHEALFNDAAESPAVQLLRRELMEVALGYQRSFFERHADDPALKADLADALTQLGAASQTLGDEQAALKHYAEAIPLWEALRREHPEIEESSYFLVKTRNLKGQLLTRRKRLDDARGEFHESLQICRECSEHPGDDDWRPARLMETYVELGGLERAAHNDDAALLWLERGRAVLEQLLEVQPHRKDHYLRQSASLMTSIGNLQWRLNRDAQALDAFQSAISTLRTLEDEAGDNWTTYELAAAEHALGRFLADTAQPVASLKHYREADEILRVLGKKIPVMNKYRSKYGQNLRWMGKLHHREGRIQEALQSLNAASVVYNTLADHEPQDPRTQWNLASVYEEMGAVHEQSWDVEQRNLDHALRNYVAAEALYEELARGNARTADAENRLNSLRVRLKALRERGTSAPDRRGSPGAAASRGDINYRAMTL